MTFAQARTDLMLKTVNAVHKTVVTLSGGRVGGTVRDLPMVKVTTVGRTSGQPRSVMLAAPVHVEGRYVLVASKGGDDRHPDWYRNLVANSQIVVEPIGGDGPIPMTARTATGDEKAELWSRITSKSEGYAGYQEKTDRDIPVVICEPSA